MESRFRRGLVSVGIALAVLAAACGDDDDSTGATTAPATPSGGVTTAAGTTQPRDVDPNGILKLPFDLQSNGGPNFDPIKPTPPSPNTAIVIMLYDTLLRQNADGSMRPGLAKTATVIDPSTIKFELFPNIKFTDGTPLDAEAAKFGILRQRDQGNTTLSQETKEVADVVVDGPLSFTMKLKTPIAGAVYDLLGNGDFLLVSPKAVRDGVDLSKNPVGAGPFKVSSITPQQSFKYVKNPDFFQADQIRLAGVDWIHVQPGAPMLNALRAANIDVAEGLTYAGGQSLQGAPGVQLDVEQTDNVMLWLQLCKNRPPFDDLRVRQALNFGLDRADLNNKVYGGLAEPMWGFFGSKSPLHNKAIDDIYRFDPVKARQLLAEAGQANLTFDLFFATGNTDRAAEVMQQQWKAIGVTVNLKPLVNTAEFFPDAKGAPANVVALERTGVQKVFRTLAPPSVGNVCNWNDAPLNDAIAKIKSVAPDSREAVQHWADLQKRALEQAMSIFGLFGMRSRAYLTSRVGNPAFLSNFQGRPSIDYYRVYVKK